MEQRKFVESVGVVTAAAYVSSKLLANDQVTGKSLRIEGPPGS